MKKLLLLIGFSLNIIISQSIVSVEPNSAVPGSGLWVTITGEDTYFVVTDTVGAPSNVETVKMTMGHEMIVATSFTPVSRTVLEAFFAIPEDATIGSYDVVVEQNMGYGSVLLANGFSIAESVLLSVEPNSAAPGSSLWVTILGEGTHFLEADTVGAANNVASVTINRDDLIIATATSFTAVSRTELEAFFEIPEAATTGACDVEVHQNLGHGSVTLTNGFTIGESVSLSHDIIPINHLLHQNFPNPFNPTTNISFSIAHPSISSLIIYDVSGNIVRELKNGFIPEGEYNLTWDGRSSTGQSVASGLYIYQLKSNSYIATKKMLMIK